EVDRISPEAVARCRELLSEIQEAVVLGDRARLEGLDEVVSAATDLDPKCQEALRKRIADGKAGIPDKFDTDAEVLRQVTGKSRSGADQALKPFFEWGAQSTPHYRYPVKLLMTVHDNGGVVSLSNHLLFWKLDKGLRVDVTSIFYQAFPTPKKKHGDPV